MEPLWGDRCPGLGEVRPVLGLLVEAARGSPWHAALVAQAERLRGVSGTCWYVDLDLAEGAIAVPEGTPIPCAAVVTRDGVVVWGSLLLWIGDTGLIETIEYAAGEMAEVDHYPRLDELVADHSLLVGRRQPPDLLIGSPLVGGSWWSGTNERVRPRRPTGRRMGIRSLLRRARLMRQ